MKKINTLVVGQGIAGSLVAYMLHQNKIPFTVIDPANPGTASRVAAGMFTPISGKRKTIHPAALEQIPYAIKIYKEIEQLVGTTILHLENIYQVYHSTSERNDLTERSSNAEFAKFIITSPNPFNHIKQEFGAFEITNSGWLDCDLFISSIARWLKQNDVLTEAVFVYEDLRISNSVMKYHDMEFNNIIFCEGYQAINNPFFKQENIIPCKGDILTIKCDQLSTERIIKNNGIYLIAKGDDLFRAGSTYQWNNSNLQPDKAAKKIMEQQIGALLENGFTTIDHQTAIRPTTQNREVIAKRHTANAGMFILNGLGTKGVLQGPLWAKYIVHLLADR